MALRACRKLKKAVEVVRKELSGSNGNNVENGNPFTLVDEDFVMTLMIDCLTLLGGMQKQEQQLDIPTNNADSRMVRNKVFMGALSIVGKSLLKIDGMEQLKRSNAAVDQLVGAFSIPSNHKFFTEGSGKGWLPLHWAVVLASSDLHGVTKADVETLYSLDPMAMRTNHVADVGLMKKGLNPAHLMCMSPVTPISMQLVRSFSLCSPTAFGSATVVSALHTNCRYGTPTVELLQLLLQLDSSQTKVKVTFRFQNHCPLGQLCFNLMMRADELPNADDLMNCLLGSDKSKEVVGDALFGSLDGYERADAKSKNKLNGRLYRMIKMLLKANPEAAKYRSPDGNNLLHDVCWATLPSKLCIDIIKLVVALHNDAVREAGLDGWLPVHRAANGSDVEVVEFLLGLYPDAASVMTSGGDNLLHLAVPDFDPTSRAVSKVRYLCSRYPAMIHHRDGDGEIPAHRATPSHRFRALLALYEAGGVEQFKTPIAHPTVADHSENGYLSLHLFVSSHWCFPVRFNPVSDAADLFRWLLRLYPDAAGIEGGVGAEYKMTPYQLAVDRKLPNYYLRLLLRAAPTLNPPELHRLNYEERRMAMFLAFKATSRTLQAPLLA